jgi:hypothetical protein
VNILLTTLIAWDILMNVPSPFGADRVWRHLNAADRYFGCSIIFIWEAQGGDIHILGQRIDTTLCADLSAEAVSTVERTEGVSPTRKDVRESKKANCNKTPLIGDVWRFRSNLAVRILNTLVYLYATGGYSERLCKGRGIDEGLAGCST